MKAYATAADRYYNQPTIASDALFREGLSYARQAAKAEYDQNTAVEAIATFTDFITLFPEDARVPRAQRAIAMLKLEQVRGNYQIARFYENSKVLNTQQRRDGALVYYNQVLQLDTNSSYAAVARQRIEALRPRQRRQPPIEMRRLETFALITVTAVLAGCAGYHLGPVNGAVAGGKVD